MGCPNRPSHMPSLRQACAVRTKTSSKLKNTLEQQLKINRPWWSVFFCVLMGLNNHFLRKIAEWVKLSGVLLQRRLPLTDGHWLQRSKWKRWASGASVWIWWKWGWEAREDTLQIEWAMKFSTKKQRRSAELAKSLVERLRQENLWAGRAWPQQQQFIETFEEGRAGRGGSCSEFSNNCRCRMLEGEPLRLEKSKW